MRLRCRDAPSPPPVCLLAAAARRGPRSRDPAPRCRAHQGRLPVLVVVPLSLTAGRPCRRRERCATPPAKALVATAWLCCRSVTIFMSNVFSLFCLKLVKSVTNLGKMVKIRNQFCLNA